MLSASRSSVSASVSASQLIKLIRSVISLVLKSQAGNGPSRRHIQGSKIAKGLKSVKYSLLQYPHEEQGANFKKKFGFFFDFFWSPASRIVPKNVKGEPLRVLEHPFFWKIEKN